MNRIAGGILALALGLPRAASLSDVLIRASEYVRSFHAGFRTVIADEEYVQVLRTHGLRSGDAQMDASRSRSPTRWCPGWACGCRSR
jgi:hypothetical protein